MAVGIFLRVLNYPNLPAGLNQDEVASGYEAFSLLLTGADKWGNNLPVYLPGWGSGQNVLLAYLQVPFIFLFGLNTFAIRLPSLILGILILHLIYKLSQRLCDSKLGLLALFLAAILPWPIMSSRWALESNILPFLVLLGLLFFTYIFPKVTTKDYLSTTNSNKSKSKKIETVVVEKAFNKQNWWLSLAFVPLAIGVYSYAISFLVAGIFLILVIFLNWSKIKNLRVFWVALVVFSFLCVPFVLTERHNLPPQPPIPLHQ